MKKLIFLWVLLSSLLRSSASTYAASNFQKKLSCKVTENAVRVYLVQESETLKCEEYLTVINSYLKTTYHKKLIKQDFYKQITIRNSNTFEKIAKMLENEK